jgi:hypothetical protein|tara:strand:- start:147 stop:791 length:645 start_codon:yes stop_codon:yes gene_type:complete
MSQTYISIPRHLYYLHQKQIIYRRNPITDEPTAGYNWGVYFEEGTYEYYDLFRSKAKINTYKSLKWHLLVLWYLNPKMDTDEFIELAEVITNYEYGFITFFVPPTLLEKIISDVCRCDLDEPPKNKLRKFIFKDNCGLTLSEKLSIVGKMIGRSKRIHPDDIYQCMLDMHDMGKKITINRLAGLLDCSSRTIYRNMTDELKTEKELLNKTNEKI